MILSGKQVGEKSNLNSQIGNVQMNLDKSPLDKYDQVTQLQQKGHQVAMIVDGLKDAGALKKSNIGIVVSNKINVFSPSFYAIKDARQLIHFDELIDISLKGIKISKLSFLLFLLYNVIGLNLTITGQLQPDLAALLMPLSLISIVAFTPAANNWIERKILSVKK